MAGHGRPREHTLPADTLTTARELALEVTAILQRAVTQHDPAERALLEELHLLHLNHAKAHRYEAVLHEQMAERIGKLITVDDRENRGNSDGLLSARLLAGMLEPYGQSNNEPAACCA